MKFDNLHFRLDVRPSGPARDLWIEIPLEPVKICLRCTSGPARDLWIEMLSIIGFHIRHAVGSRKGPVD